MARINDLPYPCERCHRIKYLYEGLCEDCLNAEDDIEALRQIRGEEPRRWIPNIIK